MQCEDILQVSLGEERNGDTMIYEEKVCTFLKPDTLFTPIPLAFDGFLALPIFNVVLKMSVLVCWLEMFEYLWFPEDESCLILPLDVFVLK